MRVQGLVLLEIAWECFWHAQGVVLEFAWGAPCGINGSFGPLWGFRLVFFVFVVRGSGLLNSKASEASPCSPAFPDTMRQALDAVIFLDAPEAERRADMRSSKLVRWDSGGQGCVQTRAHTV